MLEEIMAGIETQERARKVALSDGDPERAWAAQARGGAAISPTSSSLAPGAPPRSSWR